VVTHPALNETEGMLHRSSSCAHVRYEGVAVAGGERGACYKYVAVWLVVAKSVVRWSRMLYGLGYLLLRAKSDL